MSIRSNQVDEYGSEIKKLQEQIDEFRYQQELLKTKRFKAIRWLAEQNKYEVPHPIILFGKQVKVTHFSDILLVLGCDGIAKKLTLIADLINWSEDDTYRALIELQRNDYVRVDTSDFWSPSGATAWPFNA